MTEAICSVDGCDKPKRARGLCQMHYFRLYRSGSTEARGLLPCGTNGAYQRHKLAGEEPCEPCKQAKREFQAAYRAANPRVRAYDRKTNAARNRARTRLVAEYPDRFRELMAEELAR